MRNAATRPKTPKPSMDYTASVEAQLTFAAERIAGFLMSDFGRNMFRLVVAEGVALSRSCAAILPQRARADP